MTPQTITGWAIQRTYSDGVTEYFGRCSTDIIRSVLYRNEQSARLDLASFKRESPSIQLRVVKCTITIEESP